MRILIPLAVTTLFLACSSASAPGGGPATATDSGSPSDEGGAADTGTVHGDSGAKADTGSPSADAGTKDSSSPEETGSPDTGSSQDTGAPETGPTSCTPTTCPTAAGSYAGVYSMDTAEKVGSTVVNEVTCTGTNAITIDLSQSPAVSGTVACHYSGGLVAFDSNETATIAATVMPDGSVSGQLTHVFGSGMTHSFSFQGTLANGTVSVMGTSSWYPNAQSAVPWDVTFSFTSTKK